MRKRVSPSLVVSCVALFFSLSGVGIAAGTVGAAGGSLTPVSASGCAMRLVATATFRCSLRDPTVHVYVNHKELLIADMLATTATVASAVFYGDQTVVRVTQSHESHYRVSVVTLLPGRPTVWVRLRRN